MTKKTMDLIITIIAFATEVLVVIKEKISGRKGNGHQRNEHAGHP
jgi:hypothetical protein